MLSHLLLTLTLTGITADQGFGSSKAYPPWRVTSDTTSPVTVQETTNQLSAFGEQEVVEKVPVLSLDFNYAINSYFVTTTTANGGTVTQSTSMAVLQTSTATNGSALMESRAAVRYIAGTGVYASFTARFTACAASSQQEVGLGDSNDGFFMGCQNSTFGMFLRNAGSDTFTALSAASIDHLDGTGPSGITLVQTNLTLFKVSFGWHGAGPVKFYVFDVPNGRWVLFHVISAGVTAPRVLNPTLPLHAKVVNSGNATNLTVRIGSMGAYREGGRLATDAVTSAPGAAGASKSVTTEQAIITIQNQTSVFSGKTNRVRVRINQAFAVNQTGNASCTVHVTQNTTLGGSPSFTAFDATTSVVATDTAGTTISGGRLIYTFVVTQNNAAGAVAPIDLSTIDFLLNPGDTVTFSALSSGVAQTVFISVNWSELFTG